MKKIASFIVCWVFIGFGVIFAQDIQISGTVTSVDDGSALPGVSVFVKGTSIGTASDINGDYSITVPPDATLVFSSVGMKTQEVQVAGQTVIDVSLETEVLGLEEVIVTAIGISRAERALGYSVATISSDETLQKSEPDLLKSLEGKIPGVDIRSTSGAPGSATRITIRGNSSFLGDNQPLFVVDGIPYSNDQFNTTSQNSGGGAYGTSLSTLDPNDIASVSVLKGAPAAALYGSRAKNGVVVITTKSRSINPSKKGLEVAVSSSVNWEQISNLPEYQNTYGNGVDFVYANANGSWGPRFDSRDSIETWPMYLEAFPEMGDSVPWVPDPDNVEGLFKTGLVYENSVNIAGGDEKSAFNLTASMLNNDGYIPHSSFDRYSISLGGTTLLANKLRAGGTFSYSNSKQSGGIFGNNQADDDNAASSFARALWLGRAWDYSLPYTSPITGEPMQHNGRGQFDNPLWSWEHNKVITDMDRIVGTINLSYNITDWLNASYELGVNTFIQRRQQIIDKLSRGYQGLGAIIDDDVWQQEIESNFLLTFSKQLGSGLDLKAILGHNVNQQTTDQQAVRGFQIISPGIYDIDNTSSVIPFGGTYARQRLMGVFADVTVGYKNFLYLNLTGRNDWSSTLPVDNRSYFYPAASASFMFSELLDVDDRIFSLGKLRVGWGKVGMDADPYSIYTTYISKAVEFTDLNQKGVYKYAAFPFLGQSAMTTPDQGNDPELNPEFKTEFEVGTNLGFINNRVNIDFTYYSNKSTDMIYPVEVPPSSGITSQWTNVGEMTNKGVEVALDLVPIKTGSGLTFDIYSTFTKNISEVTDVFEGEPEEGEVERTILYGLFGDPFIVAQVGQPYGVFLGEVDVRDDDGNLLINAGNGFLIRSRTQEIYGDPNPDYKLSVIGTLSFKGFSLRALVDYTKGGDVYSYSITTLLGRGVTKDTEDREHSFVIPGFYGDPNTEEPLLDADGNEIPNITQVSMNDLYFGESFAINAAGEWQVYDATKLSLREISVGYDLPKKLLSKTPFGTINISLTGRNLWFYAPNIPEYTHFDPEVNAYGSTNVQGVEYTIAPSVKRYGVNLKITF
jgi:TonB-linked SusC/RagA family outer membrane protein